MMSTNHQLCVPLYHYLHVAVLALHHVVAPLAHGSATGTCAEQLRARYSYYYYHIIHLLLFQTEDKVTNSDDMTITKNKDNHMLVTLPSPCAQR